MPSYLPKNHAEKLVENNTDFLDYKSLKGKFNQLNCVVCMEDFHPKDEVRRTHCDHMFHHLCLVKWAKQNYKN
jgi:hypothetical protein